MLVADLVIQLVKSVVPGYKVYNNFVPENKSPALAVSNITYSNSGRRLSGKAFGKGSIHRISVVTKTDAESKDIVNKVLLLDNTTTDDFQRVYVEVTSVEPFEMSTPLRRVFIELTVKNK
jgi:hypothetical protein